MVVHLDVSMKCVYCNFQFGMRFSFYHQRILCIVVVDFPVDDQVADDPVGMDSWVDFDHDNLVDCSLVCNLVVDSLV